MDRTSRRLTTLAFVNGEWVLSTAVPGTVTYSITMANPYADPVTDAHWRITADGRTMTFLSGVELLDFSESEKHAWDLHDRNEMDPAFNPAVFRDLETRWLAIRELTDLSMPIRRSERERVLRRRRLT